MAAAEVVPDCVAPWTWSAVDHLFPPVAVALVQSDLNLAAGRPGMPAPTV